MDGDFDGRVSRFLEIVKRLQRAGVPHFRAIVTHSPMEIPASFVRDHGENMKPSATLRLSSGSKVWPVEIHVCYSKRFRVRFGNLYKGFISDNGLKKGDELIVSLVAMSEFVIYTFKRNVDPRSLSRDSQNKGTTSSSMGDGLPAANTPKSSLRKSTLNPSTPGIKVEMEDGNISDNVRASPVNHDRDKFKHQMAEIDRHARIPNNCFNGTIFFQKQMSEASVKYFGNPQFAHVEIPADFVRHHGKLLSEGAVITLEGPMPGTISQVVCHHGRMTNRIMWRRGWPDFVRRNQLRAGVNLEFSLVAPSRFSVRLRNSSTPTPSFTMRNSNVSEQARGLTAQGGETSGSPTANCMNRSAAHDLLKNPSFIKTIPPTSDPKLIAYPFLAVPASFWQIVNLPVQVNLQGPNSEEIFPVKYAGEGASKNLSCGWRAYADTNAIEAGDKLRFTYTRELQLFVVVYV